MNINSMEIVKLRFNWRQTNNSSTSFHEFDEVEVGRVFNGKLVTRISEHSAQGEGDKWYYTILFKDDTVQKVFNMSEVFFKPSKSVF